MNPTNSELKACPLTDEQIKHMVERFLTWKLPENFHPDAGIKFEPVVNLGTEHQYRHEPVGTNLFDYTQAEQMVRHMLDGLPDHTDKIAARMGARFEDHHGTRKSEALADDAVKRAAELRDVVMPVIGACLLMQSDDPKLAHPRLGVAAEVANAVAKHLSALRSTPPEADLRAENEVLREARCPLCQTAAPEAFVSQCNWPECPYRSNTK